MTCAWALPPTCTSRGLRAHQRVNAHVQRFACEQHSTTGTVVPKARAQAPSIGGELHYMRHRHHRQPNFARNLSRSFFEMPQKRCNSNDANSMFESVVGELRAELLVDSHSWASGQRTEPTHRAADRSSRHGRLAGRPRCSPAPRPGPAPIKPAGPQASASVTQQHVVFYNPSVILGA